MNAINKILTHHIAKITEIVGSSEKGWEEAAQVALDEAKKTIREITGIEVVDMTATVDPNTGSITKYKTTIKIAFGVER
ncbi:MAG TPA: dodecin family protein [Nitrososphaeraceae archaeon]|jgi:flavin-binding protein dodecin|nr:dodecin family protein [Nitrososphaeraceae archaeon]HZL22571.1 dodecin family protein [Nitrososphaeraceae archaeon]